MLQAGDLSEFGCQCTLRRSYECAELIKWKEPDIDLFWFADKSLFDADSLPPPDVLVTESPDDIGAALKAFTNIVGRLGGKRQG